MAAGKSLTPQPELQSLDDVPHQLLGDMLGWASCHVSLEVQCTCRVLHDLKEQLQPQLDVCMRQLACRAPAASSSYVIDFLCVQAFEATKQLALVACCSSEPFLNVSMTA